MKNEEYRLQKSCVQWFNVQHKHYQGLLFMNMNNPRNKVNGKFMKYAGMVSGVADLTFLHGGKVYFIEMKTPAGVMSDNQKKWSSNIKSFGYEYYVIKTLESFMELINYIVKK